ncbi:MAG: DNA repair protein RecO [Tissierellia bacterium]|nr:DNA repair protein RecO [Tissierellia bacterium]
MDTVKVKTQGIVLDDMRYGDSSKIIRLFTETLGIVPVMVKGAYLPKSPYVSLSQPFTEGTFRLTKGNHFFYVREGQINHMPMKLRSSYDKIIAASLMAEVVLKSLQEEEVNTKSFFLLKKSYRLLEKTFREDILVCGFLVKLMAFLGFRPSLDFCIKCRSKVSSLQRYDISGGVLCSNCFSKTSKILEHGEKTIYYFRKILYSSLDQLLEMDIEKDIVRDIINLVLEGLQYHLEIRNFNSIKLLP